MHYDWIIQDTDRYLATLGVTYKYLHGDSPFPKDAARSPVIETYQRNQALNYSYSVTTDPELARRYSSSCTVVGEKAEEVRAPLARWETTTTTTTTTRGHPSSPLSTPQLVVPPSRQNVLQLD